MLFSGSTLGSTEILGVSHLILGVRDMGGAELFLARYGHSKYGEVKSAPNPREKSSFVAGALARTFDMKLMVSATGSPPVELLRENVEGAHEITKAPQTFEAVLAATSAPEPHQVLDALGCEGAVPFIGFREVGSPAMPAGVSALVVHCHELESALSL